ncbi:MAG TPA: hypothetical protein VL738_32765 [Dactylosporangium sp.]|nr:hypothetical protein [Dactylosporangium sp.]
MLTVVAALAVAGVIAAGNNPRHYVHLMPYGRPGVIVTVLVVAPLLLGAAAWLVLRNRIARGIAAAVAVVLALAMCADGVRFTAEADAFGTDPSSVTVLGVAPGGRFELVRLQYSSFIGLGADIVRVRSREGLRSREDGQDLACASRQGPGLRTPSRHLQAMIGQGSPKRHAAPADRDLVRVGSAKEQAKGSSVGGRVGPVAPHGSARRGGRRQPRDVPA